LVRGEVAARAAEATAAQTFAGGGTGDDLPSVAVGAEGMRIGALLTEIGFTASNGEAKRKIAEGAVRLDGLPIIDPSTLVEVGEGDQRKLSLGKKKHGIVTR
jgi:tyrosyl-tRNA synthetase